MHGILVVSILYCSSQWIEDTRATSCEQEFFTIYSLHLFFIDMIKLLMAETNKYYSQYLGTLHNDDMLMTS
jgi:hypothetical protein